MNRSGVRERAGTVFLVCNNIAKERQDFGRAVSITRATVYKKNDASSMWMMRLLNQRLSVKRNKVASVI